MITKNTAKRPIKKPINGVVPQPGDTLPYSEFNGFKRLPRIVTLLVLLFAAISYLIIRGGSRKKIAKKMIPKVPTNKNV